MKPKPSVTPNYFAIEELDRDRRDPQVLWLVLTIIGAPLGLLALVVALPTIAAWLGA